MAKANPNRTASVTRRDAVAFIVGAAGGVGTFTGSAYSEAAVATVFGWRLMRR
jgi:hypothetical protein